ncbi:MULTISPECIES: phage portal protein [unclassified Haematobacter]|uniref:phage portal protein n=1 Tax=unclassified Haematobacter TaxID=2640585 RepID=UPI0025BFE802|nr:MULTISPECIES: phage portal protein [unclassified Haematobacter]
MPAPFGIFSRIFGSSSTRSGIEAAAGGRRWKGVARLGTPQQAALAARKPSKDRANGLYLNTPMAARGVETWTAELVGKGWQAQSQHPDRTIARRLNAEFEDLIAPLLPMIARAVVRDGEAFIRLMLDDGGLRLVVLPADQIDPELHRDHGGGARVVAGVEFDAADRVVAYHVLRDAPDAPFARFTDTVRVPEHDMLHVFDALFPGQVRGLSWLVPVAVKIGDHDAANDALLMKLKVEALLTGFIRDTSGGTGGFKDGESDWGDVSLEPGAMRILPPGADVTFTKPEAGSGQSEFLRAQQREIAAGLGLTYEQLTGDLSGANYSSARVGLLEFRRRAEMLQRLLIEGQFLRPLWKRWIAVKALAGEIAAAEIEEHQAVRFVAPGWQWVDPAKEVAADVRAIEAGLKSRAEVVAGRGRDIAELDEEIAADLRQTPMGPQA